MTVPAPAERPTPILLVGMNRSGTKWLSNILCNHPRVVGIQSEHHTGILETNLFGRMQALIGDLDRVDHFVAFVELWSQTDFFKASGVDKELLYRQRERPRTMLDAFRLVMNEVAMRAAATHWLQKCSPTDSLIALRGIPDARVVTIQREIAPTLESSRKLDREHGEARSLIRMAAVYAHEAKLIAALRVERAATPVRYEDLERQPEAVVRGVCGALGLEYRSDMLKTGYRANTSFDGGARERLTTAERRLAVATARALELLPVHALGALRASLRKPRPVLVPGTFREITRRYDLR